jgi:1-acyl-sn-glycerol-3-phosphate acyltransferase
VRRLAEAGETMARIQETDQQVRERLRGEATHGRTVAEWAAIDGTRVQRITRRTTAYLWRAAFRSRASGAEHVPETGAFILCPNHSSWVDGFIQLERQRRAIHVMGKSELFRLGPVTRYLVAGGVFPVERGQGDLRAREIARLLLERGTPVLIYPEGTRKGHQLGEPHSGAALLALQTGVPVVPAASIGIRRWGEPRRWHWPKVTTVYGEPLHFEGPVTQERVALARDAIWERVQQLHEQARELHQRRW